MKLNTNNILLLAVVCVLFSSCCKEDSAMLPGKDLTIGVLMPLTGSAASAGESAVAGLGMALADVNAYLASTGNALKISLEIMDTGSDPSRALEALQELHDQGIRHIVGPYSSADVAATLDFADAQDMFILSPSSVASSLAIAGDNCYRLAPSDGNQAEAISALFLHDKTQAIIPVVRNDVWGNGLLADVKTHLDGQSVMVGEAILFDPVQVDAVDIANQIESAIEEILTETFITKVGVYMLSFGEGAQILDAAATVDTHADVKWYGSSAFANNAGLTANSAACDFAEQHLLRCPAFAPDPSAEDLWGPVEAALTAELGRSPEIYALTSYDALWVMTLAQLLCDAPDNIGQFKTSLEELTGYYNGITGRMTLDAAGDRKFASFNFWGVEKTGAVNQWKAFGKFNNANGELNLN